jgi:DNA invertase Pin-like site-specific DNA recombinase
MALASEKVQPWHRDRLAVVYVRQSTVQQVLDHQESTRLQYGLAHRAEALGWAPERVLVIDDDLGKSGASAEGRAGFQRLVSEVSLDQVGIIFGIEMSRLARSNADWHRLLELCALFRTLIADLDGVYDPAHYNDRLLLGLKGTMSEAELHILKQRMHEGRLSKARRGELSFPLPVGYIWRGGEVAFDPDEQVQEVVRLVFRKFEELGTLGSTLRYLAEHDIRLGVRVREGPGKGELVWRRPNRMTLQMLLKHPLYAGAYVYGRRQVDPRRQRAGRPRTGRVVNAPEDWLVLLPDHVPPYLSWAQYEANQARLAANRARAEAMGAVRDGPALLAGLVRCARCGCRMGVHYGGGHRQQSYECTLRRSNYGEPYCQHLPGACLDEFVSRQVLLALEPAALEVSLAAVERLEEERAGLLHLWQQRRERARYESERAARQYHAVEPENRLVARSLERAWEEKLAAQQRLEEDYQRFLRQQPQTLTAAERDAIRRLAADIPALWGASTTTAAERKEILRQVVEHVVVAAEGASERVRVRIVWVGGGETEGVVVRPIAELADLSYYPQLCQRLAELSDRNLSASAIADQLHADGFTPARAGVRFGPQGIRDLQKRLGLRRRRARTLDRSGLGPDEWLAAELMQMVGIAKSTVHTWIQRGWVRARREAGPLRRGIVWADAAEVERLRQLHRRSLGEEARQRWSDPTAGSIGPYNHAANGGSHEAGEEAIDVAGPR